VFQRYKKNGITSVIAMTELNISVLF
jgi:hypothetical protein